MNGIVVETPLLTVKNLRRTFGETVALDSCSLSVRPGEIHAVIGENGSGKSTLIKILSGIMAPEQGELGWGGTPCRFASPRAAQTAGVATVFQETLVLDEMSVRDNMILGLDRTIRRYANASREVQLVKDALSVLGLGSIDIERSMATLSLANRQLVAIARSLLRPWRLLILDESTSALDIRDRDRLFAALRDFRKVGRSILFVSHRMDEIEQLADRMTVLRSGRSVATLSAHESSTMKLLELMSTREGARAATGHRGIAPDRSATPPIVTMHRGVLRRGTAPMNFELRPGEIVGIAGLEGHGQVGFLECIAGIRNLHEGVIRVRDKPLRSARDAARLKVMFLPRDRKNEGIFAPLSVLENVTIACLGRLATFGIIRAGRRKATAEAACRQTRVKMASPHALITTLSGGNQQKVLLGRLIATEPAVLILNDPLRGVDLEAKQDLYGVLEKLAGEGLAILLLSTELIELCILSDRVIVFHDHGIVETLSRGELTEDAILKAMFGQKTAAVEASVR